MNSYEFCWPLIEFIPVDPSMVLGSVGKCWVYKPSLRVHIAYYKHPKETISDNPELLRWEILLQILNVAWVDALMDGRVM